MREPLDREALHEALVTSGSPWTAVDVHPALGSTNAESARLAQPWRVVVTDHQRAGRGRLGRTWETPAQTSVTASVLLPAPDDCRGWMPLVAGLAVMRAIGAVGGRKVCGILCELQPAGIVVGLGINVDQERDELPVEGATSLRLAGARDVSREDLLVAVLRHLVDLHGALVRGGHARSAAQAAYREACLTLGREVDLHAADGAARRVRAVGIDAQGRLVVTAGGPEYAVAAGDVVHARPVGG